MEYIWLILINVVYNILLKVNSSIVEIDESVFGKKRKYNRGRTYNQQWVFGMVERNQRNLVLLLVDNRKKDTLLPLIQKHVLLQAKIYHDDWVSYRNLQNMGYEHDASFN